MTEYGRVYGAGAAWEGFPIVLHTARVVVTGVTEKPPIGIGGRRHDVDRGAIRGA